MPNITNSLVFDKVRVTVDLRTQIISAIAALSGTTSVGYVRSVGDDRQTWDVTDSEFLILRDAVHVDMAVLQYQIIKSGAGETYFDSALPARLARVREWDPMYQAISALAVTPDDVGPGSLILYKYLVVGADDDAPTAPALPTGDFTGDLVALRTYFEGLGWYLHTTDAASNMPAGLPNLYFISANYYYDGEDDIGTLSVTVPGTGNIQFSTDFGQTWSFTPPADYSDVTTLHLTIGGEEVEITIRNPVEDIDPIDILVGEVYPPYSGYPYSADINHAQIDKIHSIQIMGTKGYDWSNARLPVSGSHIAVLPVDEIQLVSPHKLGWDSYDSEFPDIAAEAYDISSADHAGGIGRYMIAFVKPSGHVSFGLSSESNINFVYISSYYYGFKFIFEKYPESKIHADAPAMFPADTTFEMYGIPRGMTIGDTVYMGNEQMRITAIGTPQLVIGLNYKHIWTAITVVRRINGTSSPIYHGASTPFRVGVNRDKLRRITFLAVNGLSRPFLLRIWGHRKEEREVVS